MSEQLLPDEWDCAYVAGLNAARGAVARLQHKPGASIANAVSAIDGLVRDYLASSQQNAYNNPQGAEGRESASLLKALDAPGDAGKDIAHLAVDGDVALAYLHALQILTPSTRQNLAGSVFDSVPGSATVALHD